ncbi:nucleoside hydrolase [Agrococcus sp. Marseille-Q4369]|uniref:nucleoside hydrolase n=1 Tax=Agrococcus sp. Marseille-Q4369 TaxID=2810513 RepID=UPI001B8BD0C1|nr:nucleoside hydrolase [Agrococcus sp. Marseille-Q4369]QUW17822.1 nucleoside hydrolase [Agrococcus sp. Marseille-Q4369]
MRTVVVDTDAGVDDALALMLLAANENVELLAVLSVFGTATAAQTADNARYTLDVCERQDVPVYRGCAQPLAQARESSWGIHGRDGFGNTGLRPQTPVAAEPRAVDILLELVATHPHDIDYIALGPLTNLAAAIQRRPDITQRLRSITILGSLGPAMLHDTEPWLDRRFRVSRDGNVTRDFDAAQLVARQHGSITWCGPYVTRQVVIPESLVRDIAATGASRPAALIAQISEVYADFYSRVYPQPGDIRVMGINDSIAVASVLQPSLITAAVSRPLATFADPVSGQRYLAGVHADGADPRPRHSIVSDMDFDGVIARIDAVLRKPLPWR